MENKSIYNIQQSHLQLMQEIEQHDGEITPEIDSQLTITGDEFEDKAVSYGYLMKHVSDQSTMIKHEIERLKGILKAKDNLEARLKQTLTDAMILMGVDKVTKNNLTLSLRKSEVLVIEDDATIPCAYLNQKIVMTPDKNLLKGAINEGLSFEGVSIVTKQNLQIK